MRVWIQDLSVGEGADASGGGGRQPVIYFNFVKNPMKLNKMWSAGRCAVGVPHWIRK